MKPLIAALAALVVALLISTEFAVVAYSRVQVSAMETETKMLALKFEMVQKLGGLPKAAPSAPEKPATHPGGAHPDWL